MDVEVIRINRFTGKSGFMGYATVKISFEDYSMVINGFTISETKSGKLMGKPPQTKSPKDDKWYDVVTLEGDLLWKISNEIVRQYENGSSGTGTSSQRTKSDTSDNSDSDDQTTGRVAAARSKADMARKDGLDKTITKTGKFNPWEEA